jgi:serine/threonine-protein kinase
MSSLRTPAAPAPVFQRASAFGETIVSTDAAAPASANAALTMVVPSAAVTPESSTPAAVPLPVPSGAPLAARFHEVQKLGEGGMGEVVLSQDQTIGRRVAIKKMKPRRDSGAAAGQFLAEVQMTGRLEHPGIVPIYDAGQDVDGTPYFVMKFVDGEPLDRIIKKLRAGDPTYQQHWSFEHRTQVFMQLLQAVKYAHRQGILHLDIKPANVVVGPYGEVVLVDWGIARAQGQGEPGARLDAAGKPVAGVAFTGTPDYMSPEQALGKRGGIGPHSDTYCLCVLFYELITLHYYLPPKESVEGRLASILLDEPLTGLQMHHRFGAPPELTNYIHYGLNKSAEQRYRTVDEMVDKLQQVMDGQIPVVCPCTGIKRAANNYGDFMNAHPILSVAGVAVVGLFALFGAAEVVRLAIAAGLG